MSAPGTKKSPPLVVVIEDDCSARAAIGRLLQAGDFEPALFDSAESFIQQPPTRTPLCLVIDIQLPGMSGLDLQRQLRQQGSTLPMIMTTGSRDDVVREKAYLGGCAAFFRKPSDGGALLAVLDSLVRSSIGGSNSS
jgi:FixJ family two-component response regulator